MEQYEISFRGEDFLVQGDYEKAENNPRTRSNGDPGDESFPHSFLITKVLLETGEDVTDQLDAKDFQLLSEKILEQYYED